MRWAISFGNIFKTDADELVNDAEKGGARENGSPSKAMMQCMKDNPGAKASAYDHHKTHPQKSPDIQTQLHIFKEHSF